MQKDDELRPEFDLRRLRVRRFGSQRRKFGAIVRLDPDVAELFPSAEAVNEALRAIANREKPSL
ncbi:MAG: hypothetical protein ACFB9N_00335 [Geitlerinemataceae cyanobacterium]